MRPYLLNPFFAPRISRTLTIVALGALSLFSCLSEAQVALPEGVTKGQEIKGVQEFFLKNGLTVLLAPDPGKATITVNVTYKVGSRNENYGETGMAHLLEHLMFKGTPNHPNIAGGLTSHGMRPNGTTWYDRTNYFETFSASKENLDWALEMEADRMVNSFIARKDLDSEMTVVRNEMERGENSPEGVLSEKTAAAAFMWHNYGKSTIGARSDVENVSIERLQAFYHTWYQPDNAVLVVAGRIETDAVLKQIQALFGAIPKPQRVLPKTYTLEPTQDGERLVVLRRAGDQQHLNVIYHAVPAASADFQAFEILTSILGASPSGRLHKALTEKGLAISTGAEMYALLEPGMMEFSTSLRLDQSLEAAEKVLLSTLEGFAAQPVTDEEVNRARTRMLASFDQLFADPEHFGVALSGAIAAGDWRLFFLAQEDLKKVTAADVQRVAVNYLKASNRTLGRFIPEEKSDRAPTPRFADAATRLKDFHPEASVAQGEVFEPTPQNIESRVQRLTLPGGLKLGLLNKRNRGETVSAKITLHWGTEQSVFGLGTVGQFASALLDRGGAGLTRQQIREKFDQLHAKVGFGGGATGVSVNIETIHAQLPEVLALVGQLLRKPAYPESEFKQAQEAMLAGIEEGRKEPQSMAMRQIGLHFNHFPKGDVRYSGTVEEDLDEVKAVTRDQIVAFHQRFYNAAHGEVMVIGDFDPDAVKKILSDSLGNWPTQEAYAVVKDRYDTPKPAVFTLQAPDKANAFFYARMGIPLRDDHPDVPLLTLANYIIGEGFLNSRLATRIRQKEGLSYGVGSFLHWDRDVEASEFGAYAIYAPQNRAKLETAFKEEMARVLKDGFTAEEVKAASGALLQSRRLGRAQDAGLAGLLADYMRLGRTMAFSAASDAAIAAATPESLLAALRKHIDPANLTLVFAGDFAQKAQ
jgi:zinc protease